MSYDIAFVLDGVILVFLAVTIFYAARLSIFLKSFRQERESMIGLIRNLSVTIDKAEGAIAVMKQNAAETSDDLQKIINEAKFLSDELNFMNESGDNLAHRLERLADRNKELVTLIEKSGGIGSMSGTIPAASKQEELQSEDDSLFDIHDIDIDDEHDFLALEDGAYREQQADSEVPALEKSGFDIFDKEFLDKSDIPAASSERSSPLDKSFSSRAEQDLYEALQRKKRVREVS